MRDQGRRLRIVDEDDIGVEVQAAGVFLVRLQVALEHGIGERLFLPLQGIVETLGDAKELLGTADDLPPGRDPQLGKQRDVPVQHLGDSPADSGGVDMDQRPAADALCQPAQEIEGCRGHDRPVVVKANLSVTRHCTEPPMTASQAVSNCARMPAKLVT